MQPANEKAKVSQAQRTCARLAGILFVGAIIVAIGGGSLLSKIAGDGTFAEKAARIAVVIVTFSSPLLAFALYATLKPVNSLLALGGPASSTGG